MDPIALLQKFVSAPGPPGQEGQIRDAVQNSLPKDIAAKAIVDPKGNLVVQLGDGSPNVLVAAHLDEIAMIVRRIEPDGRLAVSSLGGLYPWKIGEGPVLVMAAGGDIDGVLSLGSIHTNDPNSNARRADNGAVTWSMAKVFTGLSDKSLSEAGVRPGTRVVVHPSRRNLLKIGDHVGGFFLDDRADLVSWVLALTELAQGDASVTFAATTCEETGGEGAQYLMRKLQPDVCIALELGPFVADAPVKLSSQPTVWVHDGYSSMTASDCELVAKVAESIGIEPQFQNLSRGGSDATCAASAGLCARPITLGLPMENSHGFEIIHKDSMQALASLTAALVKSLS